MDFSKLDQPQILMFVFHPREDWTAPPPGACDYAVPVDEGVSIACRFYPSSKDSPSVLYFHGNGEVVYDYDDIASLYNGIGVNLFVADYRGYGRSGGTPTFSNTVTDAGVILDFFRTTLHSGGYSGPLFVMGRSLGSLSAVEIASKHDRGLSGLIIESGFASAAKLLLYLIPIMSSIGLDEFEKASLERLGSVALPALIMHGEWDEVIPFEQGQVLFDNIGSTDKELVAIPRAGHNDIMITGMEQYFTSISRFVKKHSG